MSGSESAASQPSTPKAPGEAPGTHLKKTTRKRASGNTEKRARYLEFQTVSFSSLYYEEEQQGIWISSKSQTARDVNKKLGTDWRNGEEGCYGRLLSGSRFGMWSPHAF